jgi:hypothetical protein
MKVVDNSKNYQIEIILAETHDSNRMHRIRATGRYSRCLLVHLPLQIHRRKKGHIHRISKHTGF